MPFNAYADLGTLQRRLTPNATFDAHDTIELLRMLSSASRYIDGPKGANRRFYPETAIRYVRAHRAGALLELDADLLSVSAVAVDEDGDRTYETSLTEGTDYELANLDNENDDEPPYNALRLLEDGALGSWPTARRSVKVTGRWGYSEDTEAVLTSAGAAVTGTLADATDTTLVTSAVASPEIAPGMRLKLGSEDIEVISGSASPFTVRRGINGTTAAAQAAVAISKYTAPADVTDAMLIELGRINKRKDTPILPILASPGFGDMSLMTGADPDIKSLLGRLRRLRSF